MIDFPLPATAYEYRALRRRAPHMVGWDVYALQTGLLGVGRKLTIYGADGDFGKETGNAVRDFQRREGLEVDGIAGVVTQRAIALKLIQQEAELYGVPYLLSYGQVEHESSFWLGNHSAQRTDGSRDNGVAQRNSAETPAIEAYDTPEALKALSERVSASHGRYTFGNLSQFTDWELAAGSWNAPAWTDMLAEGKTLSASALAHITAYIEAVTAYFS